MTYNLTLNQVKMIEWGLSIKAGLLMCKMVTLSSWATGVMVEGDIYYVLYRSKIKEEIPILGNSASTISKYLNELLDKALIDRVNENAEPAYKLTAKGKEWISDTQETNDAEISPVKRQRDSLSLGVEVRLEDVSDEYKKELNIRCYEYCKANKIKDSELSIFANWHLSKGTTCTNWYRAFIMWCKRGEKNQKNIKKENNTRGDLSGNGDNF